jgi:hypothetical protein
MDTVLPKGIAALTMAFQPAKDNAAAIVDRPPLDR